MRLRPPLPFAARNELIRPWKSDSIPELYDPDGGGGAGAWVVGGAAFGCVGLGEDADDLLGGAAAVEVSELAGAGTVVVVVDVVVVVEVARASASSLSASSCSEFSASSLAAATPWSVIG